MSTKLLFFTLGLLCFIGVGASPAQLPDQPDAVPSAIKFLPQWPAQQRDWFPAPGREHPGIATGPSEGSSIRLGEDLAALCGRTGSAWSESTQSAYHKSPSFRLNVLATDGPLDSVWRLLNDDEVQLAITHADIWHCAERLAEEYKAQNNPERAAAWQRVLQDTRMIMPLYGAPIHILVNRRKAQENGITDLLSLANDDFLVAVGPPNSDSAITSYLLRETLRPHTQSQWRTAKIDTRSGLERLEAGKVDAVILVGAAPHPVLASHPDWETHFDLLKFGRADVFFTKSGYTEYRFTQKDYAGLPKAAAIATRQVKAVLVTHRSYSGSDRKALWVRHTVYRLLERMGDLQEAEVPKGLDWLRAADLWPKVSPAGLTDSGWPLYSDTKDWVDAWAKSYRPPQVNGAPQSLPAEETNETPTLPFLPLPGNR